MLTRPRRPRPRPIVTNAMVRHALIRATRTRDKFRAAADSESGADPPRQSGPASPGGRLIPSQETQYEARVESGPRTPEVP